MPEPNSPPVETPPNERPTARLPPPRPKEPTVRAPVGACDCHIHVVAGGEDFGLWEGRAEDPHPAHGFEDWLDLLRAHLDTLGCTRGVVVQSILHGTDNAITVEAIQRLGRQFRGVALVAPEVQDHSLEELARAHIRAIRLNLVHGGPLDWPAARRMAPRLAERGLHIEMLLHADQHLEAIADDLEALPVPVVLDHAGWPEDPRPDSDGVRRVCRLLAEGRIWVKLSALYRMTQSADEAAALAGALIAANPERCVWGSDWPHLLLGEAEMPDSGVLFDDFTRAVEDPALRQAILVDNPARLYGF